MAKNGWKMTQRKDPNTGNMRDIAILYRNGKEIKHKWLTKAKRITEKGLEMDQRKTNSIVVDNYPQNRKKWEDYHDQIDVKGMDN